MWVDTLVLMNTHPLSLAFPYPPFAARPAQRGQQRNHRPRN